MEDAEKKIKNILGTLKNMGLKKSDGEEITPLEALSLAGIMSETFSAIGKTMQESYAEIQLEFAKFAIEAEKLGLIVDEEELAEMVIQNDTESE